MPCKCCVFFASYFASLDLPQYNPKMNKFLSKRGLERNTISNFLNRGAKKIGFLCLDSFHCQVDFQVQGACRQPWEKGARSLWATHPHSSMIFIALQAPVRFHNVGECNETSCSSRWHRVGAQSERSVCAQVQGCNRDLSQEKKYYKRYRVCMDHLKMQAICVDGNLQRFCQQCGRFHDLDNFDGDKR